MIEYQLNTGFHSTGELFYQRGQVFNGVASILNSNRLDNDITANGQTFLETLPVIEIIGLQEVIDNSGQFFLTGGFLKNQTGFLDVSYNSANLKFDSNISGHRYFFNSSTHSSLLTGFSGAIGNLAGANIYLNGIKLVSGEHYQQNANGNFVWLDPDNGITGVLFSRPQRRWPVVTGQYDLLTGFRDGSTVGYLNGVKLDDTSFLETSSLLTGIIQTGLEPFVEFPIAQETNNLIL